MRCMHACYGAIIRLYVRRRGAVGRSLLLWYELSQETIGVGYAMRGRNVAHAVTIGWT